MHLRKPEGGGPALWSPPSPFRVSIALRDTLKALADQQGVAMQTVVEEAVRNDQDVLRLRTLNESLARLSQRQSEELQQEYGYWESDP